MDHLWLRIGGDHIPVIDGSIHAVVCKNGLDRAFFPLDINRKKAAFDLQVTMHGRKFPLITVPIAMVICLMQKKSTVVITALDPSVLFIIMMVIYCEEVSSTKMEKNI